MNDLLNRQYYLAARPLTAPTSVDIPYRDVALRHPGAKEVLIRNLYISLDPAIRGWMGDAPNYAKPIAIGDVVRSTVIARVIKSNSARFAEGDVVRSVGGWELYSTVSERAMAQLDVDSGITLSHYLSIFGPVGLTSYFGLLEVGKPQSGETVLVSAAAGAVGSIVGQIAKIKGCRVVGLAGSDEKCQWLTNELGFDEAINYKKCGDYEQAIKNVCPEGVDVYFDNVGGEIFDAALLCLNKYARVAVCGWISTYNSPDAPGPKNLWQLVAKSVTIKGFVVVDYRKQFSEGVHQLQQWVCEGKIKFKEDIVEGLDNVLPAFLKLFDGTNQGKLIVKIPEIVSE